MVLDTLRGAARLARGAGVFLKHRPDGRTTVADVFEQRADRHPERPFLLFDDRTLSWGEVDRAANRVAAWARGRGVVRGDVVALLMENRPEYVVTWLGLAKLGAVTALVNTNLAGRALDHALRTAGPRLVVVGSELADSLAGVSPETTEPAEVWIDPDPEGEEAALPKKARDLRSALEEAPGARPDRALRDGLRAGDEIFYIYTSGTTGNPKAARFSHARFLMVGDAFAWAADTDESDVEYLALPLYHTAGGVVAVGRTLSGGGSLAIRRRFSASRFWDDVRRYDATCFQYIGEFCRYLMAQPRRPDDRDHRIRVIAGNGLRPDIWEPFQERFGIPRIIEFYGATEGNTVMVNLQGKPGAVGYFPPWLHFANSSRLVRYDVAKDEHLRGEDGFCIECPPGEAGELLGRIPSSSRLMTGRFEGYTSREATERKILRDVFKEGDAWFRTGDLLRRDEEGYYYFVDRIGDTFRWKGENVSTQEVAELCAGFPGMDLINVYGVQVPHADGRAGMLAYVPTEDAEPFDGEAFYAFAEEHLPPYAMPVFVRTLPEAPVTGTFKLRKVDLQDQGFDVERIDDPVYVRDDAARRYERLTPEGLAAIREGRRRL